MKHLIIYAVAMTAALGTGLATAHTVDLSGLWTVKLEGENVMDGPIYLPGTTDMAGYGVPVDTTSLTRDDKFRRLTRRYSYTGPATYTRTVEISPSMAGKPLELKLERVIWRTTASIDGIPMDGDEFSLVAPHRHYLRGGLSAGEHTLTVVVDNSRQYDISVNNLAHAYTNDTQTIWNGVLGSMTLRDLPDTEVSRIEVYPTHSLESITVDALIDNNSAHTVHRKISYIIPGSDLRHDTVADLRPGTQSVKVTLPAAGLTRWSEFSPVTHTIRVEVEHAAPEVTTFGLRSIDNERGIRINGVPVFLRGTLECCVFPLTGTPPTDRDGWLKTFTTARRWGLNHLRFHSWCPPEAAFEVADSLGFYLQVELPVWSLTIGDSDSVKQFLSDEYERIVREYGNHPSLCLISVGNELQHDFGWLNGMVTAMRHRDNRHLYTTTSYTFERGHGGKPEPSDQYFITQRTDDGWVRGQGVFDVEPPHFNTDYNNSMKCVDVPLIAHEIGQYAVYPSVAEIEKYTGTLNPLNLKTIRHELKQSGMLCDAELMTLNTARFAAILYKEEIERALKTDGISGIQLLGLQDFPGQGTATVGLLDAFWDNKGAVTPEWFREFCNPIVPLLSYESAVYSTSGTFDAKALVANCTDTVLTRGQAQLTLTAKGSVTPFATATLTAGDIAPGQIADIGSVSLPLAGAPDTPSEVTVRLTIAGNHSNSWVIHIYPDIELNPGDVVMTASVNEAIQALSRGHKVLLSPSINDHIGIGSKFVPVFWSPVHFADQAGPMGVSCDPAHPALAGFPNRGHSDWQWWYPVKHARLMVTDSLPQLRPIVGAVDNFVHNRRLAYIIEGRCGNGQLIISSIDLFGDGADNTVTRALTQSLLDYMNSTDFTPAYQLTDSDIRQLCTPSAQAQAH